MRSPSIVAMLLSSVPYLAMAAPPTVGGCQVFPTNNYWNTPIDNLPLHASSSLWVSSIGNTARLHADWGNVLSDNYGIPFITVPGSQPLVPIAGDPDPNLDYSDESDPGPYPIPPNAPIEGGPASTGDRHVLTIDTTNCVLYELYFAHPVNGGTSWTASSFAKYPLNSNALRTAGFTSADAAGLPIFPGLVRWEEVAAGEIAHAIRFTAVNIWGADAATGDQKYLWPARHASGNKTNSTRPPMGTRFRLKAGFNISTYSPTTQVILRAFKKYGLVLADGGSNWYFQGVSDTNWPDTVFSELGGIAGSNFEVVDAAMLQVDPNSAQALQGVDGNPPRLANISTRGLVQTGFNVMIGGFVISGSAPKTVVVRAIGPSLSSFGVPGALSNPSLQLARSDQTVIATNDDWGIGPNVAQITASGLAPSNALESAIYTTLQPGAYTAIVTGVGGATGVALVEVYEIDRPDFPLINISTRGQVQSGFNVMIGGFVVQGDAAQTVVIRAIGPSLANFGVSGALPDPTMSLVRMSDNATIATNDNWGSAANAAQITSSGFAPSNALESAILVTLQPGAYTAVVSGVNGATGVGLVEVYRMP